MLKSLLGSSVDESMRQQLSKSTSSAFEGTLPVGTLGIVLSGNQVDQIVTGTPADQCGKIFVGDIVDSVDGVAVTPSNAASYLRNNTGSRVFIRFTRASSGVKYEVELARTGRSISPIHSTKALVRDSGMISTPAVASTRAISPLRSTNNANSDSHLPELQLLRVQLQDLLRSNEDLRTDNVSLRSKAAWADELARRYELLRKDVTERGNSEHQQSDQLREATNVAKEALQHADTLKSENQKLRQKIEELTYLKEEVGRENLAFRSQLLQLQRQLQQRPPSPRPQSPAPFSSAHSVASSSVASGPSSTVASSSNYNRMSNNNSNNNSTAGYNSNTNGSSSVSSTRNTNIGPVRPPQSPLRGSTLFGSSSMPTQQWNRPIEWVLPGGYQASVSQQLAANNSNSNNNNNTVSGRVTPPPVRPRAQSPSRSITPISATAASASNVAAPVPSYYNVGAYPGPSTWAYSAPSIRI